MSLIRNQSQVEKWCQDRDEFIQFQNWDCETYQFQNWNSARFGPKIYEQICVLEYYFCSKWQKITWKHQFLSQNNKKQGTSQKIMMSALNITIWYVRPTKIFHNMTITLCFKSVTNPVTSKIHRNLQYLKNGDLPSGFFWWNFIFDMREYKSKGF